MGLEIVQVWKMYRGGAAALQDVRISADSGVLAVLGPAGAGKSTLGAIVATLESPSRGMVRVDGLDVWKKQPEVRRRIGYAPQDATLFPQLTVTETLDYLALVQGMDHPPARRLRISRALERFELLPQAHVPVHALSAGTTRRLLMAQATLGHPGLLILDEPTSGIEPDEAARIRALIAELGREATVLLLTEAVEDMICASSVAILHRGRVKYSGVPEGLASQVEGRVWTLEVPLGAARPDRADFLLTGVEGTPGGIRLRGISEQRPFDQAEPTLATIADGYAWLLTRSDDEVSG